MSQKENIFLIAEAGVNHNGLLDMALQMVDIAAASGADAVKFQTFVTERVMSRNAPKAEYQKETTGEEESQFEMAKKLELDEKCHRKLIERCEARGIQFLSTPFDLESVDLLANSLRLARLKIPSGEITNAPLLLKAAQTGKRVILSTGMSTLGDIEEALGVLAFGYTRPNDLPTLSAFREAYYASTGRHALIEKVVLMHCTTAYPTPFGEVNLRTMETLRAAFGLPVGLSDHTEGIAVAIAAAALGATVIEKHFTLDRRLPGPDHRASIEPDELKAMVDSIRKVEMAMGSPLKSPTSSEEGNIAVARKSLVAARPIRTGERFTEENLTVKRPGTGITPMRYWEWLGRISEQDYQEDETI